MAQSQRREMPGEDRGTKLSLLEAFSYFDLAGPAPGGTVTRITVSPWREGYATDPYALAEDGKLQAWLASTAAERVILSGWPDTPFPDLRAALFAIWEALPHAQIVLEGAASSAALDKALALWPDQVVTVPEPGPLPSRVAVAESRAPAAAQAPTQDDLEAEHAALLERMDQPEPPKRVDLRMVHLREATTAGRAERRAMSGLSADDQARATLHGLGAVASNALIPSLDRRGGAALHLGRGYMLDLAATGAEITRLEGSLQRGSGPAVIFDPRPGKVLKHEMVHVLSLGRDRQARAAISALRVVGHGTRHVHMVAADPAAAEQVSPGGFVFSDGWKLVGLVIATVGTGGTGFAALRTGALWDDLTLQADLGSAEAAETLAQLSALRTLPAARRRHLAETFHPVLVFPSSPDRGR
ncbi:MAG: hypothetical protein AAFP13_09845 [Pseudomonadota bacterium]